MSAKTLVLKPRVSEKAYALSKLKNVFTFDVPLDANKALVAEAVTAQFGVTVEQVNIANIGGKPKRTYRRGGRQIHGKNNDIKKAYVRLKEGDHIPVFAAIDEDQEKAEKATAQAEKAAAKTAKKEAK